MQKLDKLHKKSKATGRIDEFWSHSWQKRPYQKVLCLLFLKNGFAASLIGTLAASIVYTFMHNGMLLIRLDDRINSRGEHLGLPFLCTASGLDTVNLTILIAPYKINPLIRSPKPYKPQNPTLAMVPQTGYCNGTGRVQRVRRLSTGHRHPRRSLNALHVALSH